MTPTEVKKERRRKNGERVDEYTHRILNAFEAAPVVVVVVASFFPANRKAHIANVNVARSFFYAALK